MRIALFGSGSPLSVSAFRQLSRAGRTPPVVVVPPAPYAKPLRDIARENGAEVVDFGAAVDARLPARAIDLICIASFPYILRGALLEIPGINLHTSLLPRHRGIDPIFWTYYHGEEISGVTVHWIDGGCDSGDIISQRAVPLAGRRSRELYFELCNVGSDLLGDAVIAIEKGQAPRVPQDSSEATEEPAPTAKNIRTDFGTWPVRRAWHYLAGMSDQRSDLLVDPHGVVRRHGRATEWHDGTLRAPGSIEEKSGSIAVHCSDGTVVLEKLRTTLLRRLFRRLRL